MTRITALVAMQSHPAQRVTGLMLAGSLTFMPTPRSTLDSVVKAGRLEPIEIPLDGGGQPFGLLYGTPGLGRRLGMEDIRQEIGGQVSLIGTFPRDIIVPQMPIIIPKLGLYLIFNFPLDQIPSSVRMRVVAPWSPEPLFEIAYNGFCDAATTVKRVNDAGIGGRTFHILSPFMIQEPGIIRVLVTIDGEDLFAGGLEIALASPSPDSNPQPCP